jgi:hypothetical protein
MIHRIFPVVFTLLLIMLVTNIAAGLDWRDLDLSDENSPLRKSLDSGQLLDAGEWGATTFPVLAKEIWTINIHQHGKLPYPLSTYQKKWLGPWLKRWGLTADKIQIVYEANLLNDHKILDIWPMAIMDELAGQTFGNIIYLHQSYKEKDGNLLVLLSHEIYHVKQYIELGSVAEFGRQYVKGYIAGLFRYEKNPMEIAAYDAEKQFRVWLCQQEGWSCN